MMSRRFLIDGYNLLHAVGMPARVERGQLQRHRERLLALIHERHAHDGVTVVFDAHHAPKNVGREQTILGIRVIFADGVADERIHEILAHDSAPRTLTVVSSDNQVQESARRRGAKSLSAQAFLDDMTPPAPPRARPPEKPVADADRQHWLDVFQSIDDADDFKKMQSIDPMNPDAGLVKKHRSKRNDTP